MRVVSAATWGQGPVCKVGVSGSHSENNGVRVGDEVHAQATNLQQRSMMSHTHGQLAAHLVLNVRRLVAHGDLHARVKCFCRNGSVRIGLPS
jgi:hypothetical protein